MNNNVELFVVVFLLFSFSEQLKFRYSFIIQLYDYNHPATSGSDINCAFPTSYISDTYTYADCL